MSLPVLSALAAGPAPSPSPSTSTGVVTPTLQDAQESATHAASWVEENWSTWLSIGLRVLLVLVIAAVLKCSCAGRSPSSSTG